MHDIKIKICGITRLADALAAASAGADALGFIFYPPSPRFITPENAGAIIQKLPPMITTVGVFVNQAPDEVRRYLNIAPVNLLQLHGDEDPQMCSSYGFPFVKGIRVSSMKQLALIDEYPDARGLLVDKLDSNYYGGTGESFDWEPLPKAVSKPIILAGGLNADNVSMAIDVVRPYGIDVSTGVEIDKGIKDQTKIIEFVAAARNS